VNTIEQEHKKEENSGRHGINQNRTTTVEQAGRMQWKRRRYAEQERTERNAKQNSLQPHTIVIISTTVYAYFVRSIVIVFCPPVDYTAIKIPLMYS
jgi:hypothetical protein